MNPFSVIIPDQVRERYPNPMDLVRAAYAEHIIAIGTSAPLTIKPLMRRGQLDLFDKREPLTGIEEGTPAAFLYWGLGGECFHGIARYEKRDGGLHVVGIDGAPVVNPAPFSGSRGVFLSDIVREFAQR